MLYGSRQRPCPCQKKIFYKDIQEDVEITFDTSNYEIDTLLPTGKNEKVIGLMEDELGGQIVTKCVKLRAKTYSYLKDNNDENEKRIGTNKSVLKRNLKFRNYKKYLKTSQIENKINFLEKKEIDINSLKGITHYKKVILKTQ